MNRENEPDEMRLRLKQYLQVKKFDNHKPKVVTASKPAAIGLLKPTVSTKLGAPQPHCHVANTGTSNLILARHRGSIVGIKRQVPTMDVAAAPVAKMCRSLDGGKTRLDVNLIRRKVLYDQVRRGFDFRPIAPGNLSHLAVLNSTEVASHRLICSNLLEVYQPVLNELVARSTTLHRLYDQVFHSKTPIIDRIIPQYNFIID